MIENGKKVKIHYTLTVEGQVVDSSSGKDPLEYEQGAQTIIPGLQKGLEGKAQGDKTQVTVKAGEAYGEIKPEAVVEIPKEKLGDGDFKAGMSIQGQSPDGQMFHGLIKDVREENVVVDFNHPLAGKTLTFDVEVVAVS
jgi:FKBP-type peptidyl-prolyl cis-trans isomerase SlyD